MGATSVSPCSLATGKVANKTPSCGLRSVRCNAQVEHAKTTPCASKRGVLLGLGVAAVFAVDVVQPSTSWALLPDDDDADLVQKAKASRQKRLKEELATERKYKNAAGFTSKRDKKILVSVQKAVFELARAGSQLESDNLPGLASSVTGPWVGEFKSASEQISSGISAAEKSVGSVYSGISALATSAQQGDVVGSKKAYVATIAAFQDWASDAGVEGSLKGL